MVRPARLLAAAAAAACRPAADHLRGGRGEGITGPYRDLLLTIHYSKLLSAAEYYTQGRDRWEG